MCVCACVRVSVCVPPCLPLLASDSGFRVSGSDSGFRVSGFGSQISDPDFGFWVYHTRSPLTTRAEGPASASTESSRPCSRVSGFGFRVLDFGFQVSDFGGRGVEVRRQDFFPGVSTFE